MDRKRFASVVLIVLLVVPALAFAQAAVKPAAPAAATGPVTVLDGSSVWRVLTSLNAPVAQTPEGSKEIRGKDKFDFMTIYPPEGWAAVDFDDSGWAREHFFNKYTNGELDERAGSGGPSLNIRQITLRGKFTVTDPAAADDLKLTLAYRGGVAVYLNGRQVHRQYLDLADPGNPTEVYPDAAYFKDKATDKVWHWFSDSKAIAEQKVYEQRVRRIDGLVIPAKELRKGVNVLGIEIHAAAYPAEFLKPKVACAWTTAGLCELRLQTSKSSVVVPNVVRPSGWQVWNTNMAEEIVPTSYADPHEAIRAVRMVAARNGWATGRVMVSRDADIKGLTATISGLSAPDGAKLAAPNVQVRFGKLCRLNGSALRDDALLEAPPEVAECPGIPKPDNWTPGRHKARADDGLPLEITPAAFQSVIVKVRVPKDAAAGEYLGALTISGEGLEKPVSVAVELAVADWALPDPADFAFWFGLVQSPEGVAMPYGAKLWSDEHLKLMDKSFELIGQTGGKVLFVILTAETEYGNEWSMAVWDKAPDGKLKADLSAVEKFVKVATKHFKPTFVPVVVWQWPDFGKAPRITVRDEAGKLSNVSGPVNGTDEAAAFWTPVLTGVKGILDKAGLGDRMLLATGSDRYPEKQTVAAFAKAAPGVAWEAHRHFPTSGEVMVGEGVNLPVKYIASVWGQWDNADPDTRRVYGWKYAAGNQGTLWTWLDRGTYDPAGFTRFRTMCEQTLLANRRGQGQIGADFWPAPPEKPGAPAGGTLYSRFPHSANVGGGNKGCTTNQLFYPAPAGPVPTIRFELVRENIQECEARIFLEKLLTAQPCPLPEAVAKKCQAVLDERTRWHRIGYSMGTGDVNAFWPYSGWQERTLRLYQAAGEAAKALAKPAALSAHAGAGALGQ